MINIYAQIIRLIGIYAEEAFGRDGFMILFEGYEERIGVNNKLYSGFICFLK